VRILEGIHENKLVWVETGWLKRGNSK